MAELEIGDPRIEFIADYIIKSLRIKPDKWVKMYGIEENKMMFVDLFDKQESTCLVVILNSAGGLTPMIEWPSQLKTKATYFVKKTKDVIPRDTKVQNCLLYGDISPAPVDQLSAFVDEV